MSAERFNAHNSFSELGGVIGGMVTNGTFTGEFKGLKTNGGGSIESGKGTYND